MPSSARKRFRIALLATAALGAVPACDTAVDPLATFTVEVTPANDTLTSLGQRVQLSAVVRNARGERIRRAAVIWLSSNDSVATVSAQGLMTTTGNGVARITATVAGVSDTAVVTVRQTIASVGFGPLPSNATAGEPLTPPITVLVGDSLGIGIADTALPVTLALGSNPGGATLSGTTTAITVKGIATFSDLWFDKAASGYTLVATMPGQDPLTTPEFTVSPGPPVLAFLTQPGRAEGQAPFDPPVQVMGNEDRLGNPVATASIEMTLANNPTGESLQGRTIVFTVNGVATFDSLTLSLPGDGFVLAASSRRGTPVRSDPFSVKLTFVQTAAGGEHSCGLTVANFGYCWGGNGSGQLGARPTLQHLTPVPVAGGFSLLRLSVAGDVSCGPSHYAALCWGWNGYGQVGDGTAVSRWTPELVNGAHYFAQLSTGGLHTCGLTPERAAYCWGLNTFGELGDNGTTQQLSPVPVSGGLAFVQVSAGNVHTCGVTTANAAYCWGRNAHGEVGDGTTIDRLNPTLVQGNLNFVQVSAGTAFTCGVTTDHTAYCWGSNGYGELGDGTTQQRLQPTPVPGLSFDSVSAGAAHTCGLATGGAAYCWGSNIYGELGDGSTSQRLQPTPVTGGLTFLQVSAGLWHSCGAATDSVAYCWGFNGRGQLGNGSTAQTLIPTAVVH